MSLNSDTEDARSSDEQVTATPQPDHAQATPRLHLKPWPVLLPASRARTRSPVGATMRLVNIYTLLLHSFNGAPPPYAALSHRWTDEEMTYDEFTEPTTRREQSAGFLKVRSMCGYLAEYNRRQASEGSNNKGHVEWAWVDTVCIDKRSSAELSEAINSMKKWYSECQFCVVHLADVHPSPMRQGDPARHMESVLLHPRLSESIRSSEWFTRGWTLQELLFSPDVHFLHSHWGRIHALRKQDSIISEITGVPRLCLSRCDVIFVSSVAQRMSWASRRRTTRKEDEAYCLLGLFDIAMPLLYGEGPRAFRRLQETIIGKSADQSIFAWNSPQHYNDDWTPQSMMEYATSSSDLLPTCPFLGVLAPSPAFFQESGLIETGGQLGAKNSFRITNQGLGFTATSPLELRYNNQATPPISVILIELDCSEMTADGRWETCIIAIQHSLVNEDVYFRSLPTSHGEQVWNRLVSGQRIRQKAYDLSRRYHQRWRKSHRKFDEMIAGEAEVKEYTIFLGPEQADPYSLTFRPNGMQRRTWGLWDRVGGLDQIPIA